MLMSIEKYSMPFFNPVLREEERREGFYISAKYQGKTLFSECAPYPFRSEKEQEMKCQLELGMNTLFDSISKSTVNLRELLATINQTLINQVEASVIFAVETLVVQMQQFLTSRHTEFSFARKGNIELNALLCGGSPDEIRLEVKKLMRLGYRSFKLKIRPNRFFLSEIKSLIDVVGENASIRLDANRSFKLDELVQALRGIPTQRIEYIEEPTNDPKDFNKFFTETGVHYALDESFPSKQVFLQKYSKPQRGLKAFVLKPTRVGLLNSLLCAELVRSLETKAVFSSTFETNIALFGMLPFITDRDIPMGFDITRRFPRKVPLYKYFKKRRNRLYWKIPKKIKHKHLEPYLLS